MKVLPRVRKNERIEKPELGYAQVVQDFQSFLENGRRFNSLCRLRPRDRLRILTIRKMRCVSTFYTSIVIRMYIYIYILSFYKIYFTLTHYSLKRRNTLAHVAHAGYNHEVHDSGSRTWHLTFQHLLGHPVEAVFLKEQIEEQQKRKQMEKANKKILDGIRSNKVYDS